MKKLKIGRHSSNDIKVNDPEKYVSNHHATLEVLKNGTFSIEDHSANGTFVKGQKIHKTSTYVQRGDDIRFADQIGLDWSNVPKSNQFELKYLWYLLPFLLLIGGGWAANEAGLFDSEPEKFSPTAIFNKKTHNYLFTTIFIVGLYETNRSKMKNKELKEQEEKL